MLKNIIDEVDMVSAGIAQDTGTPTEDSDTREVIEELTQAVRNQEKKSHSSYFLRYQISH